jgi:hypothetical protein
MVQILPGKERRSFSEQIGLNEILRNAGEGISKGFVNKMTEKENKKLQEKENEAIKRITGEDISGITNPKVREEYFKQVMKGKNEAAKYANELQGNQDIISDLEERRNESKGSLKAYVNNPGLAERLTRPEKEKNKRLSETPIDPEQLRKIEETRKDPEFEKASPSKKYQMFTHNGVSLNNAKAEADIYAEEEKIASKKQKGEEKKTTAEKKQEFDEKLRIHKESEEYDKEVLSKSRTAKRTLENVNEAEKALSSGKVKPNNAINVLRFFGEPGKALSNALMNKETKAIQALMPEFLEGKKELFGVRLSDADLNLLKDKSIDIGNSIEANRSVLRLIRKYAEQSILRGDIASELSKKYAGYRPLEYERKVDEEFDRQTSPVKMIDPKTGKTLTVPAYRVSSAIEKGARIYNEQ